MNGDPAAAAPAQADPAVSTDTGAMRVEANPRIAVIIQAGDPSILDAVATPLAELADCSTLFVLAAEGLLPSMAAQAERLGLRVDLRAAAAQPASALLDLLAGLDAELHPCFCRILAIEAGPELPPFVADVMGSAGLARRLRALFLDDPGVVLAGPAVDHVSVGSATPPDMRGLELADALLCDGQAVPPDWGFFGTGGFWGRTRAFASMATMALASRPLPGDLTAAGADGRDASIEHVFGLLPLRQGGRVALVDHHVESDGSQPVVRIMDADEKPSLATLPERMHAGALLRAGLLGRHLLLQDADLLDPFWYYARHPYLTSPWRDCLQHHLSTPGTWLSRAHLDGGVDYAFGEGGLEVRRAGVAPTWLPRRHSLLSEAMAPHPANAVPPAAGAPTVSVICPTYNQARFLRQCLDSLLAQDAGFEYEILVGDDASDDGSARIVQEYAERHPHRIVPVLRQANLGAVANAADLVARARGRYLAVCEGDDYWTDAGKLRIQAEYLDANPDCAACFHYTTVVDGDDSGTLEILPASLPARVLSTARLVEQNHVPTNSAMYRHSAGLAALFQSSVDARLMPLDWLVHLVASTRGALHVLPRTMSAYRLHPGGIWSANLGSGFLRRWGMQYLHFHEQALRVTGPAHHPHWCAAALALFTALFDEAFLQNDAGRLFALIQRHRAIARLFFVRTGVDVELDRIVDADSLAGELRRVLTISTIVPVYNSEAFLEDCLASVLAQQGLFGHEIIVADDASSDGSVALAERLLGGAAGRSRILASPRNQGTRANYLRAIGACSGRFIAICEGDDYWLSPARLARHVLYMLHHPDAPMCFNWVLMDHVGSQAVPHPQQGAIHGEAIGFDELIANPLTANLSACFYRRDVLARMPAAIRESPSFGDWLVNLHAATLGPIGFLRDILSAYRVHPDGQWSGLGERHKARLLLACRRDFLEVFPGRAAAIHRHLPAIADTPALPATLPPATAGAVRFHLDQYRFAAPILVLTGWIASAEAGAFVDEEKYLFITDGDGRVLQATRLVNVPRPDVDLYHREQLQAGAVDFTWAGFRAFVPLPEADGDYRLALGLRLPGGLAHAWLERTLRIGGGIAGP